MGGDTREHVLQMMSRGVDVRPVSIADKANFKRLLEQPPGYRLDQDPAPASAWVNIYQRQDVSAVALFYLNGPENGLGPVPGPAVRTAALEPGQ
jgi:hypothetical protein